MHHRVLVAATVAAVACGTAASQSPRSASKVRADAVTLGGASVPGSLQYRFGKRGESPEIRLPVEPAPPARSATADTLTFSGGGGAWLRFRSGEFTYTVYTAIGRWGPGGEPRESEGLVVERGGKRVATLRCKDSAQSELGPDLYGKLGLRTASPEEGFEVPQ